MGNCRNGGTKLDLLTREIGNYFEERNRAWITGNIDKLVDESGGRADNDWILELRHHIARKRQAMRYRNGQLLRAHSQISVRTLDISGDNAEAEIVEWIKWVYRDGQDFGTEARIIEHRQEWRRMDRHWRLVKAAEADEQNYQPQDAQAYMKPEGDRDEGDGAGLHPDYRYCQSYDRVRAQRYADLWWNSANPAFLYFQNDCTNFVSQCLYSAGAPMRQTGNDRSRGWWYDFQGEAKSEQWSYSWAVSQALYSYLLESVGAKIVAQPQELNMGDLVFYDWNDSGRFQHTAIVADFDSQGNPLVNAHSVPSFHRHYLYLDSGAWTPRTRYAYVHLPKDIC